ncbi:MAG: LssY C-terminal domain-containing protein [Hyphomicrobiales bacterium]|nr:LssY C-terminal domain-containing protein [Hyphomicrobiales bacterium]
MSSSTFARLAIAAAVVLATYVVLAYLLAPLFWRHYEHQKGLAELDATTRTAQGIPGDPINIGLEGSEADLVCALAAAGWSPADPVTLASSIKIAGSVVFRRAYQHAPVSPLFLNGRKQDLAFEKPSGGSASQRHHVRFWKALEAGDDGLPVWLGAATFDRSVGVSHYTGQITHHVAPDVDAERDFVADDLAAAQKVETRYWVSGAGPTLIGRNGGGDPYFSDGEIAFVRLVEGCEATQAAPVALPQPARIAAKSAVFAWLAKLWRAAWRP